MSQVIIRTDLLLKPQYNVYLFQPQYSATVQGKKQYWLPYSAGCIWSYANQFTEIKNKFQLIDLIFRRENIDQLMAKFALNPPKVCGFSVYAWNEKYCLYIAEQIKKLYPNCIIVFGGPQCNSKTSLNQFIDCVVLAEGEESFLKILRTIIEKQPLDKIYEKSRLADLEIPSPYLTGVFDNIIKQYPNYVWSTVIETNRGCPYSCTFCDWGSLTYSKVKKFNLGRVKEELEWVEQNPIVFITNADANFGMYKERDLEIAKMLKHANEHGMLESVALTYAKNSNNAVFEIAKEVRNISRGVTVSVQSLSDDTLTAIKRKNMKVNDIAKLMKMSEDSNVPAYTELILGLPLETAESWKKSITDLLEYGQHNQIDVYFCILLRNSELNSAESIDTYKIKTQTVFDYVSFNELEADEVYLPEEFDIVIETNTMSRADLIKSYMYAWMVIHFHASGYTQQYAKYCRNVLGVSYREFYDQLFRIINDDKTKFAHFQEIEKYVTEFLTTGEIKSSDIKGVFLTAFSLPIIHSQKETAFHLGQLCVDKFNTNNTDLTWLDIIQKSTIYDANNTTDLINSPYDLYSWKPINSVYRIDPPAIYKTKRQSIKASTMRNVSFFKNEITRVE